MAHWKLGRVIILLNLLILCRCQADFSISDSINAFAIRLLEVTADEAGDKINLAMSPFTVWSLMTIVSEGARGPTARQLELGLFLPNNKQALRMDYMNLSRTMLMTSPDVNLEISNAIFTNSQQKLKPEFRAVSKNAYNVEVTPTNFKDLKGSTRFINNYVAKATNNRVRNFIKPSDLRDAEIFMTSTLYFKGQWTKPFNKTATARQPFFNDKNQQIGEVDMMYQAGSFPYSRIDQLNSHAIELPYGTNKKMAMILVLPFKGATLQSVLNLMGKMTLKELIAVLDDAEQKFLDEDIQVLMPKFSISSDLNLNIALDKMGIRDVFNDQKADLLGMFEHYLYISRLIQKAEIEVTEEGTVASSATGAAFEYKSPPPKFVANRPFIFLIVDRDTKSIIFTGKVTNPNTL